VLKELPRQFREFVASNHDKIIVADGEWAIMGGRNLGEKYFVDPSDHADAYIDTDVLLKGEALGTQLTKAFAEEYAMLPNFEIHEGWLDDWNTKAAELDVHRRAMARWMSGRGVFEPDQTGFRRLLKGLNRELGELPHLTGYTNFAADPWQGRRAYPCKILDKHSLGGSKNEITPNLVGLMDAAEERIVIQNAYLVMTEATLAAFERAAARGVKIDIHTNSPASTSNLFVQAFFVRDWKEWMRRIPTMRIFMEIHSKVFVVDDQVTLIGSYNIDPMSETINSEVVTLFDSAAFARRVRLDIEGHLPDAAECKIRVERDGTVTGLHGPDDYLAGFKGLITKWVSKLGFLRPIV
jgi:putative cardiolipin synthase